MEGYKEEEYERFKLMSKQVRDGKNEKTGDRLQKLILNEILS